jgi:hypothetical protein
MSAHEQNAGLWVFDMSELYRPVEVAALVPPAPRSLMGRRPNRPRVIRSADVFVSAEHLIYSIDYNDGLSIIEFDGGGV